MIAGLYLLRHSPDGVLTSKIQLTPGRLVVGRSVHCEVYLSDRSVSRRHAEIVVTELQVTVRDLISRNGTFVDDQRITDVVVVAPRQRIHFGTVEFVLIDHPHLDSAGLLADETADTRNAGLPEDMAVGLAALTAAQRRVFDLLIDGMLEKRIAKKLGLSQHTVHNHIRAIYRIFGVHSRPELLVRVLPRGE